MLKLALVMAMFSSSSQWLMVRWEPEVATVSHRRRSTDNCGAIVYNGYGDDLMIRRFYGSCDCGKLSHVICLLKTKNVTL